MNIVPLIAAEDPEVFGGKAVQLGAALRAGLPVPDGMAVSWDTAEAIASAEASDLELMTWPDPCAVRSSATQSHQH